MDKKTHVLSEKHVYKGFNDLSVYDLKVQSLENSNKTIIMKQREVLHCSDSVHILLYAPQSDSFVFCEQFRPGIYFNPNTNDIPFPLECVAGSIEQGQSPDFIARKEVKEEAGLDIKSLQLIHTAYASPGTTTEKTYIFYAAVAERPKSYLGGIEEADEQILTHIIQRQKVFDMMDQMEIQDVKTLLALSWFRIHQAEK